MIFPYINGAQNALLNSLITMGQVLNA